MKIMDKRILAEKHLGLNMAGAWALLKSLLCGII